MLLQVDEASARNVDERLRAALQQHAAPDAGFALSFSSGLALLGDDDADIQSLLRRADAALYEAKAGGRDRLIRSAEPRDASRSDGEPAQATG